MKKAEVIWKIIIDILVIASMFAMYEIGRLDGLDEGRQEGCREVVFHSVGKI